MGGEITYLFLFISLYFEVFMLMSFLEWRTKKTVAAPLGSDEATLPSAAIVVPCFNEARTIASTLESLLKIDYPAGKFEIIVVDDGSTDGTLAVAKRFETDSRVRVFHKENGGKHTAMNFALERTQADLIGCLDADSTVEPFALRRIAAVFANHAKSQRSRRAY